MRSLSWNRAVSVISRSAASAIAVAASASFALLAAASEPRAEQLTGLADLTAGTVPGEWREIPNSSILPHLANWKAYKVVTGGTGAAFDGRRMYFHGGGRRYPGNEVYAFDLKMLDWERLTEPSVLGAATETEPCPYPVDGTPKSSATYDGIVWSPLTQTFFRFMGNDRCADSSAVSFDLWEFDPLTKSWTQHDNPPYESYAAKTAVDPVTGHIVYASRRYAYDFDPLTKTYSRQSSRYGSSGIGSAAIAPDRRIVLIMDNKGFRTMDLDGSRLGIAVPLSLSGDPLPTDSNGRLMIYGMGLTYDNSRGVFVIWGGQGTVYTVNTDTGFVKRYDNAGGPAPDTDTSRSHRSAGVYSKWVYIEQYDVFVGYNNVEDGLWLYRLPYAQLADAGTEPVAIDSIPTEPINQEPAANAGDDQAAMVGDTVQLNGGGSTDPDGDILSFSWQIAAAPGGSMVALSNSNSSGTSFIADMAGDYVLELTVSDGFLTSAPDTVMVSAAEPAPVPDQPVASSATLDDVVSQLRPGVWSEISDSSIRSVAITQSEAPEGTWAKGAQSVITKWNGAAFDGRRMYFHGGGHKGYGGNEVYAYDFETLSWERLTEPSPLRPPSPTWTTDGQKCLGSPDLNAPASAHSYDGLVYSPATNSLFLWGNAAFCRGGYGWGFGDLPQSSDKGWEFDLSTRTWSFNGLPPSGGIFKTAVDPVTGQLYVFSHRQFYRFDLATKTYTRLFAWKTGNAVAAFDPDKRLLVLLSGNGLLIYSLETNTASNVPVTGDDPGLNSVGKWIAQEYGIAYSKTRGVFVLWDGSRNIYTLDVLSGNMTRYPNPVGPAPSLGRNGGPRVYSKWVYLAGHDVFAGYNNPDEGMWLYRLPDQPQQVAAPVDGVIKVCPADNFAFGCQYSSLSTALANAAPGDIVELAAGTYRQAAIVNVEAITIRGLSGAHLTGVAAQGKAALVVKSDNVVIDGIECSNIAVSDDNGACIRIEAPSITVRNVYFHDNEEGILGGIEGGTVLIEDSVFERNGRGGRAHGVYISKRVNQLIFRRNKVLSGKGLGHDLKSRARTSLIENNIFAGLDGNNSRAIDVPNGGKVIIRNNVIEKGANSDNRDMIGIALSDASSHHDINNTLIENNTIIFDRNPSMLINSRSSGPVTLSGNTVVNMDTLVKDGGVVIDDGTNEYLPDRAAAGIGPYPALPPLP